MRETWLKDNSLTHTKTAQGELRKVSREDSKMGWAPVSTVFARKGVLYPFYHV